MPSCRVIAGLRTTNKSTSPLSSQRTLHGGSLVKVMLHKMSQPDTEYGSNLEKLKYSLKALNVGNPKRKGRYINL